MEDRNWKLGEDLLTSDSLMDGITFDDLILAVHCNCQTITPDAVRGQLRKILEIQRQDMAFLLENNMNEIIAAAMEGRE